MPKLHAVTGPLAGQALTLPEGEWSVGRQPGNQLWLADAEVSRTHCIFRTTGEKCSLTDLGSRNKTRVNGEAITSVNLAAHDEIRIGESVFWFAPDEPAAPPAAKDSVLLTRLRREDSAYLSVGRVDPPSATHSTRNLKTLLRLSNLLHSLRHLPGSDGKTAVADVQDRLSSLLSDLIPSEHAELLVDQPGPDTAMQARKDRVALWNHDIDGKGTMAIAAPVIVREDVPAVIFVETSSSQPFDEGHLQFVTALAEIAAVAWENAWLLGWLEEENQRLKEDLELKHDMMGQSPKLVELRRRIGKAAQTASSVLIIGESGTGKELTARAIHRNSPRAAGPFVAINCAALVDTLLESELFGHERGAFTGATAQKKGKLEVASGGTVFLDELGELSPTIQAKLLRVLETREMERVGGTRPIPINIRIVAATNRNLEEAVRAGTFRHDLYFRLKVLLLETPSLRECPSDIVPLAEHFAKRYSRECGRTVVGISPEARARLTSYAWPGNVRELQHAIESAIAFGSTDIILAEDLPEQVRAVRASDIKIGSFEESVETAKREAVLRAFEHADGNHDTAAKLLGLHPKYLHKLLRTMDLRKTIKRRAE